jgi:hypothetical protein
MTILATTVAGLSIGFAWVAGIPEAAEPVLFVATMTLGSYGVASWLDGMSREIERRRRMRRRRLGQA